MADWLPGASPVTLLGQNEVRALKRIASMGVSTSQRSAHSVRNAYPPEVFILLTDILADLVLADLKQFPQIPIDPRIDRCAGRENTMLLKQDDGK